MAQTLTTTSSNAMTAAATLYNQIAAIAAQIAIGVPIQAASVRAIVDQYNLFAQHYHTINDLRGIDTFGNVAVYGAGTYTTTTTAAPTGFSVSGYPGTMAANGSISAADINTLINLVNTMRSHLHGVADAVS